MPLFLGRSLRLGGVNCSSSCCQFASSLDSRSIDGLFLSSRSRKSFMASLSGGLRLNCSVEEFFMGLIIVLDDISLRIFRTSSSRIFLRHQFIVCPFLWQYLQNRVVFCLPCWLGWKVREVTATALTWYSFNFDRKFFISCPSVANSALVCASWDRKVEDTSSIKSFWIIWAQKSFHVAFGRSIRYSWVFRWRYLGLSPCKL